MTDETWTPVTVKELGYRDFTATTDNGWAIPHEVVELLTVGDTYLIQTEPDNTLLALAVDNNGSPGDVLYQRPDPTEEP